MREGAPPGRFLLGALLAGVLTAPAASLAQSDTAAKGPAIEPEAVAALTRMGRYLQSLKSFSVKGVASSEQVLPQGLKVQTDTASTMQVVRPDRVRAEQTGDRRHREIVYDGKTFSVYSKSSGYYAQTPAAATLPQLAAKLESEYALELPLLDLMAWGDDGKADRPELKLAKVVGLATIRGTPCDQYVFRQDGRDWQVWIQRGAQPLPRRLVLTSTTDPAHPRQSADYDWTLEPQLASANFSFRPPAGAVSVPLARVKELAPPKR